MCGLPENVAIKHDAVQLTKAAQMTSAVQG
jgi:hypothetical protein